MAGFNHPPGQVGYIFLHAYGHGFREGHVFGWVDEEDGDIDCITGEASIERVSGARYALY